MLTGQHMDKLDELITEIQAVYCDIYSNRHLTVTTGIEIPPTSAVVNAAEVKDLTIEQAISG